MSIDRTPAKPVLAFCDACNAIIPISVHGEVDHGILRSEFGFNSPLDNLGERLHVVMCEGCWRKACVAVGLDPGTLRPPESAPPALDKGTTVR